MKTRALMAVLLAVSASVLWWSWGEEGGAGVGPGGASSGETGGADRAARAAERATRPSDRAARTSDRSAAEAEPFAGAPVEGPASLEADAAAAPASPAELREHLDASFDQQAADATWSGPARLQITQKLAALMPPSSTMKAVECRATMCRLEMVYDDLAQYQAFMSRLSPEALPWNGTLFATPLGDPAVGPVTFVAFLSRDGQPLAVD